MAKIFIENGGSPDKIIWALNNENYICCENPSDDLQYDFFLVSREDTVADLAGLQKGKFLSCIDSQDKYVSKQVTNKLVQLEVAKDYFLVPKTINCFTDYPGDLIMRPVDESGSRGLYIFQNGIKGLNCPYKIPTTHSEVEAQIYEALVKKYDKVLVQEYLPESYLMMNMDILVYNGKVVSYFCHLKEGSERFTHWFNGVMVRTPKMKEIAERFVSFAKDLGNLKTGLINPEFMIAPNGDVYFIECNFRYSGTMSYPWALFKYDLIDEFLRAYHNVEPESIRLPARMYKSYKNLEQQWEVQPWLKKKIDPKTISILS